MTDQTRSETTEELAARLTPLQYHVTQEAGTERPFTGEYWDAKDDGVYRCVVCEEPLFDSNTKYDSGSGWPSFWQPIESDAVATKKDFKLLVPRNEVVCGNCGAHLGHVFNDGPQPTGERFCMNSASLRLDREAESGE